jgi:hypothetical protein
MFRSVSCRPCTAVLPASKTELLSAITTVTREKKCTVGPRVTTGLTYDQLGLRPKFLFWLTTKSRVTTRASASASVASTYPVSRAVHCERSRCLLVLQARPCYFLLSKYVQYKQISSYRKRVCNAHGTFEHKSGLTTRMAFVSFSLRPDTRVCGRNSGQCSALYN